MDKPGQGFLTPQRVEEFMNHAAINKYQNNIRMLSDAGHRRQIAVNCQKLQSVLDTLMMCETEYHSKKTSRLRG